MKIVSLGAVLMDQTAFVERFPGEDDEVFVPKLQLLPGGSAANFAVFCARFCEETGFIGKVGNDPLGDSLIADLKKEKVDTKNVVRSDLPTGTVFIAVRTDGQRMMFAHSGAANDLKETDINLNYLNRFNHLHLADLENVSVLEYAAKHFKGTVSLNPGALVAEKREKAVELIKEVDILICSEDEVKKITRKYTGDEWIKDLRNWGPSLVVLTRGSKPVRAFDGTTITESPTFKVPVVDTTGAGDAFSAAFICEYLKTKEVARALKFANAAAALAVQHRGSRAGFINRVQIEKVIRECQTY